ncbi:mannosyltransferase [Dokdonia sp. Asnod1-B02]|uniref:mannosyltransferase n=1 Tax=Dokdonia sp. Asnod1-B02 TaxID=3160573 RepID=UPI00386564C0
MIARLWKYQKTPIALAIVSLVTYYLFAFQLERANTVLLLSLYSILFACFYFIVSKGKNDFSLLLVFAVALRLIFIPVIPNLSQDFYRFIWDGRMFTQGLNPYLTTPQSYIEAGNLQIVAQARQLYEGMGALNGSHFTNYPPVNQLIFGIAGLFSGNSIIGAAIVFRITIILADVGIIIYGKKLLQKLGLPIHNIFWYALNPFIIIEMTGNLHFESVMLFFVVLSLYLLAQGKWILSAIMIALSISTKLLPLLFLPFFMQYFLTRGDRKTTHFRSSYPWKVRFREITKNLPRLVYFYLIVIGVVILTFLPFLTNEFAENFGASIALWFKKFEFNASVYYIIRYIGYQTIGWNIIGDVGPLLPKIVLGFLIVIAFFRNNRSLQATITAILIGISFYFLMSTTVHPWYVATPLLLCVFTRYRFPLVWSATVMLSYAAYGANGFNENLWLVAIEYIIVIVFFIWEVYRPSKVTVMTKTAIKS